MQAKARATRRKPWPLLALCGPLVIGALLASAPPLQAQERERLLQEIDATSNVLERARAVVEEHGNARAAQELRFAFRLQEEARALAFSAQTYLEMRRAYELTRRARFLAHRALRIASEQAQLEQRALHLLERLERELTVARERAAASPSAPSARALELAERRLDQAREAFHEQRFQEALNMSLETTRLLHGFEAPPPARHLERMLENTRRLLERAEAEEPDAQAALQLERARELLLRAEGSMAAGQPMAAEGELRQARELILGALRTSETLPEAANVDLVLEETAAFVDEVTSLVRELQNTEAAALIDNARRHLERARELHLGGKLRQALEEARVARNLARRAAQLAGMQQM